MSKVAPIDKLSAAMAQAFVILKEQPEIKTIIRGVLILAGTIVIIL